MSKLITLVLRFLLNLSSRYLLIGVLIYSCYIAIENYNYWFSWHVILSIIGVIPLMTEALMLFAHDEVWALEFTRKQKYWIHGTLILSGTILVIVGSAITFYYMPTHLDTIHGITGLVAMVLYILSVLFGVAATYSSSLSNFLRPVVIKFVHNFFGLSGYVIGIVSIGYSFYSNWFVFYTTSESRIIALIATIIGSAWVMNPALVSLYHQLRTMINYRS